MRKFIDILFPTAFAVGILLFAYLLAYVVDNTDIVAVLLGFTMLGACLLSLLITASINEYEL